MSEPAPPSATPAEPSAGMMVRVLDAIERGGNKMPHPAILCLRLCVGVIVLSGVAACSDVSVSQWAAAPSRPLVKTSCSGGHSSRCATTSWVNANTASSTSSAANRGRRLDRRRNAKPPPARTPIASSASAARYAGAGPSAAAKPEEPSKIKKHFKDLFKKD